LGIVVGGANRFIHIGRIKHADPPVGLAVALDRERLVGRGAGKRDRPSRDDAAAALCELAVGIGDQMAEKHRQQILELVAAAEDAGLVKK